MENDKRPREEPQKLSAVERLRQRKRLEEEKKQAAQRSGAPTPPPAASAIATGRGTPVPQVAAQQPVPAVAAAAKPATPAVPVDPATKHLAHKKSRRGMFGAKRPPTANVSAKAAPQMPTKTAEEMELLVNPEAVRQRKEAEAEATNKKYLEVEGAKQPFLDSIATDNFLFGSGVPDVEWWDRQLLTLPRYTCKAFVKDSITEMVHHPVGTLGVASKVNEEATQTLKLVKTKGEIRKERRAARDAKAKEHQELVARGEVKEEQQFRRRNLHDILKEQESIAPTKTRQLLEEQYMQREIGHQRRNFDRHWEAVEHQEQKKEDDKWKLAAFAPRVAVFRLFAVTDKHIVEKIKININDKRLKGAVYWVDERDVIVMVVGGVRVVRKLEKYICHRLPAQLPSSTRSVKIFEGHTDVPAWFHFNPESQKTDEEGNNAEPSFEREWVYVKQVSSCGDVLNDVCSMDDRVVSGGGAGTKRVSLSLRCALDVAMKHEDFARPK